MDRDDSSTIFLDVILLALAGFVCIAILLLPHINPPATVASGRDANESVIAEITWDNDQDADIDLWVKAPGDTAVGYSNKGGVFCNLLRDDLGSLADPLRINHEETICRSLVTEGRYTVNAHAFRATVVKWPIEVRMRVSVKRPGSSLFQIVQTTGQLDRVGEEITLANFILDESGYPEPGSVDMVLNPIRDFKPK